MNRLTFNILGVQGSGKGTQSNLLITRFNMLYFGAGEELRKIVATKNELGDHISSFIDKGDRVPFELMAELTKEVISKYPKDRDILFDGICRSISELELQERNFQELSIPLPILIYLDIDKETAIERLSRRRICSLCGKTVVIDIQAENSVEMQKCTYCGGQLIVRADDQPSAIEKRISLYFRDTVPVIEYYRQEKRIIEIDGRPSIEEVSHNLIQRIIEKYQQSGREIPGDNP